MTPNQQPTAIFVADSHFHLDPDEREQRRLRSFCDLLDVARQADHLFLVGDIFDFWFDYPHFRLRGYEEVLQALDRVKEAGTILHFVGGNHDIWAATFLHQRYGTSPDGEPFTISLGDRRIRVVHGDGLLSHDRAYNAFRRLVRTRTGIVLAKSLHPELLYAFSKWLSGHSRSATRDEAHQIEAKGLRWVQAQQEADWDLTVMGHVHHPFCAEAQGRTLTALAGWFDTLGYGLLKDGVFRLLDFERDPVPEL